MRSPPVLRGSGSKVRGSKIHADTACRVPLRDAPSAAVAASLSREGAVNADRSPRPSLLHPLHWQGQPRLPGAPDPFRAPSTMYHSSAPLLPPPSPYLYFPCVRLHCTMPCYGTPRVCVLECPPLGRPSLIKLVLVKKGSSTHTFSLGFKWFTGYLLTGWVDRDVRNVRTVSTTCAYCDRARLFAKRIKTARPSAQPQYRIRDE